VRNEQNLEEQLLNVKTIWQNEPNFLWLQQWLEQTGQPGLSQKSMRRFPTTTRSATLFPPKLEARDFAEKRGLVMVLPPVTKTTATILEIKV
jgi:hypothetical protein